MSPNAVPDATDPAGITLTDATTDEQLDAVRALMRSFVAWHRERHVADLRLIDGYFDGAAFDQEVAGLPGKYRRPQGRLLLASIDGRPVGCVALRSLGDGSSEMKRMFVDPEFRGRGVGKALAVRLIDEARSAGYRTMRLDTSVRQLEAIGLYERLGFTRIGPYYELPDELVDWLVFMELSLQPSAVVEVGQGQRLDAISTLVAAFVGDPVERWLYPSASDYFAHFGRFVEAFAGQAFDSRTAWAIEDCSAVALWLPAGTAADGDAIGLVLAETVAEAKHADTFAVLEQMAAAHPAYPHWYLALMGVDPAAQGRGLGSRLLASGLERVDADHLPAYLETPNPLAVPLYERHGFVVSGRAQAGTCPPLVSMVRAAR